MCNQALHFDGELLNKLTTFGIASFLKTLNSEESILFA